MEWGCQMRIIKFINRVRRIKRQLSWKIIGWDAGFYNINSIYGSAPIIPLKGHDAYAGVRK